MYMLTTYFLFQEAGHVYQSGSKVIIKCYDVSICEHVNEGMVQGSYAVRIKCLYCDSYIMDKKGSGIC